MKETVSGSSVVRRMVIAGFLVVLALAATAADAGAAEVHFDPDSPAGKEYALPLPQARNDALGDDRIDDRPPSEAPLFGVGISGGDSGGGATQGPREAHGESRAAAGGEGSGGDGSGRQASPRETSDSARATGGSSYALGTAIILVAAVLVGAVLLGLGLRVLARPTTGRTLGST
jgi:hypothetical protein